MIPNRPFTDFDPSRVQCGNELDIVPSNGAESNSFANEQMVGSTRSMPATPRRSETHSMVVDSHSSTPVKSGSAIVPTFHARRTLQRRRSRAALEANTAAWGYTKVALLFFVSLLVTWVSDSSFLSVIKIRTDGVK